MGSKQANGKMKNENKTEKWVVKLLLGNLKLSLLNFDVNLKMLSRGFGDFFSNDIEWVRLHLVAS